MKDNDYVRKLFLKYFYAAYLYGKIEKAFSLIGFVEISQRLKEVKTARKLFFLPLLELVSVFSILEKLLLYALCPSVRRHFYFSMGLSDWDDLWLDR
jgi:hypothetical protein